MVFHTTNTGWIHRAGVFPYILVLSHPVATVFCAANKAERNLEIPFAVTLAHLDLGFSPHEAHAQQAFFGWLMPTIRTSEFTVLQIVGLDAAVVCMFFIQPLYLALTVVQLLNFYKTGFYLFSVSSCFAVAILMPINWKVRSAPC